MNFKLKQATAVLAAFGMLFTMNPSKIFAEDFGSGSYEFSIDCNSYNPEITVDNVIVNGDNWTGSDKDRFFTDDGQYNIEVKLLSENKNVSLRANGDTPADISLSEHVENNYTFNVKFDMAVNSGYNHLSLTPQLTAGGNDEDYSRFNGSVYFVWTDENSGFYYHKIDGLTVRNSDGSYDINYVKSSTLIDDTDNKTKYDITKQTGSNNSENYYFCWTKDFESIKETQEFQESKDKMKYLFEKRVTVDPTGAVSGKNSISTNGDREFRLTIYNDELNSYQDITVGVADGHKYFPMFWDPTFFSNTKDISGSTLENPTVFETYLLEDKISIKSSAYSSEFKSVEAVDVPMKAVTIDKVESGQYNVKFNSNFYDKVKLKITDINNNVYYVLISRITLQVRDNFGPNTSAEDEKLTVSLLYPSDKNYNEYQLVAKVNYKNGKTETKILNNSFIKDEQNNYTTEYEGEGGTNLKFCEYEIPCPNKSVKNVELTVIKKGALGGAAYGGTFAGSNAGINYDVDSRQILY